MQGEMEEESAEGMGDGGMTVDGEKHKLKRDSGAVRRRGSAAEQRHGAVAHDGPSGSETERSGNGSERKRE